MVTIVDAVNIWSQLASIETLTEAWEIDDENDTRTIADLLLDQIEFANVIILNKAWEIEADQAKIICSMLHKLNPEARIISTDRWKVILWDIIDTKLFDFDRASSGAWRIKELNHEHVPETEEYGISSFVRRAKTICRTTSLYFMWYWTTYLFTCHYPTSLGKSFDTKAHFLGSKLPRRSPEYSNTTTPHVGRFSSSYPQEITNSVNHGLCHTKTRRLVFSSVFSMTDNNLSSDAS